MKSGHEGVAECAALPCKNFLIRFEQLHGLSFFCFGEKFPVSRDGDTRSGIRALLDVSALI